MTNQQRLAEYIKTATPEEAYKKLKWLISEYGLAYTQSTTAIIEWLKASVEESMVGEKSIKQSKWIPCSERLPKELETVLVCVRTREKNLIGVSYRSDYNYWNGLGRVDVTAWMPLPEPYVEE